MFESRSGLGVQHYVIKLVGDLRQADGFLLVLRFPPPIKLPPRYNWNIVESGVKHHKPTKPSTITLHDTILFRHEFCFVT